MKRGILLSAAALICSGHVMAQDNVCVDLAKTIGLNYSRYLDADEQKTVAKADLCSEQYSTASSSKKAQLAASYKVFSGSASASETEVTEAQSEHCESHFGDYWRSQIKTKEALTVSAEGASVITTCLEMTKDSLLPTLEVTSDGKNITMAIQYKPNVQSEIRIRLFGPIDVEKNSCTVTKANATIHVSKPDDVSQTLRPTESVTIACRRESNQAIINGVKYDCTDETIFNIATSGPVKTLKIPRVCSETIQESRADRLEKMINSLNDRLDNVPTNTAMGKSLKSVVARIEEFEYAVTTPDGKCPTGMDRNAYYYWPTDQKMFEQGPFQKGGMIGGLPVQNVYLCIRRKANQNTN